MRSLYELMLALEGKILAIDLGEADQIEVYDVLQDLGIAEARI